MNLQGADPSACRVNICAKTPVKFSHITDIEAVGIKAAADNGRKDPSEAAALALMYILKTI